LAYRTLAEPTRHSSNSIKTLDSKLLIQEGEVALAGANALLHRRDVPFACLREMLAIAGMTPCVAEPRMIEAQQYRLERVTE
jgi:hypothetical protein